MKKFITIIAVAIMGINSMFAAKFVTKVNGNTKVVHQELTYEIADNIAKTTIFGAIDGTKVSVRYEGNDGYILMYNDKDIVKIFPTEEEWKRISLLTETYFTLRWN